MSDHASSRNVSSTLLLFWFAFTLVQLPFLAYATSRSSPSSRVATIAIQNRELVNGSVSACGITESALQRSRDHTARGDPVVTPRARIRRKKGRKMLFGIRSCVSQDLTITQGPVASTSGIPTFLVQIINLCGACAMSQIHVACGNWASATPVDPFVFSRLSYNDCLVNNGKPLSSQGSVTFQYSNSAMYPMSIISADNECQP